MVSTPTWHTHFYLNALESIARDRDSHQVLISGTADYSMLAHVLWAYQKSGIRPFVTVLDLCETPLFLCKWYGKSMGVRVKTISVDILTFNPDTPFDIITTDAFLTRFPPDERKQVINKWYELLQSNGHIVTTVRIEPGLSKAHIHTTPEQADTFRRRALQEARRWQGFIRCPAEQVANLAKRYAERMISYSFSSEEEVRSLFINAGFTIKSLNIAQVPGEMAITLYAEIVAFRP